MPAPRKIQVIAAFAALYLIWGSTYLAILFAIQSIPPFLMAGARFLLAGLIMFAIARTKVAQIDLGRVANGADRRCVSVVRRKRRRNALGKSLSNRGSPV